MEPVKERVLLKAVGMLGVLGLKFVVLDDTGRNWGNTTVEELTPKPDVLKKKRHSNPDRKRGEVVAYHRPFIENLKPGEVACIPFGKYTGREIRSGASAWASLHWGPDAHSICIAGNEVQLLRLR